MASDTLIREVASSSLPPIVNPRPTIAGRKKAEEREQGRGTVLAKSSAPPVQGQKRQSWDRQDGETSAAYQAFCYYRDKGPERSIADTKRNGFGNAQVWSSDYSWLSRALAYDDYMEKRLRQRLERQTLEMAERQAKIGQKMQEVAMAALESVEDVEGNMIPGIQPESIGDVVKLVDVGTRVERLALGQDTSRSSGEVQFSWSGPLPSWAPKDLVLAQPKPEVDIDIPPPDADGESLVPTEFTTGLRTSDVGGIDEDREGGPSDSLDASSGGREAAVSPLPSLSSRPPKHRVEVTE